MKTRKTLLVVGAGLALLGSAACNNDNLTNLNKNPNSPTDVPAGAIFTYASRLAVSRWLGAGSPDLRGTEWVAQQLAEVQYPDEDDYKRLQGGQTAGNFDNAYQGELEDFRKVIAKGMAAKDPGTWAPAMIMRSWVFANLTDMFGDIPYFQALKGDSTGGTLTPKYDKQQDIYNALFASLDSAVKALNGASNSLGGADPIYSGDPMHWREFANALRMRLAMRTVNVNPQLANAQIAASLADGALFTGNADAAQLAWPGDGVYNNPWSDNFSTRDDHRMSQTFMNLLFSVNDPRVPIWAQPTVQDTTVSSNFPNYAGMPNGLTQATASPYFNDTSRPGVIFYPGVTTYGTFGSGLGKALPSWLMTYADQEFILAEAAQRGMAGLTPAQAAGYYDAGVTASMQQWSDASLLTGGQGISAGQIASYLVQPGVALSAVDTTAQRQIVQQRWFAYFTDGLQAWTLWRRTCVPNAVVPGPFAIISTVPRRFEYSITEYSVNGTQVSAALAQMGGADKFTTRMWWDTNPTAAPTYTTGCGTRP